MGIRGAKSSLIWPPSGIETSVALCMERQSMERFIHWGSVGERFVRQGPKKELFPWGRVAIRPLPDPDILENKF